ncbi:MAG: hypothetical protein RQ842_05445, partial [Vulcanisaeta sp.]|nr:hypothetical protein [Vulcanisaeta sp.]
FVVVVGPKGIGKSTLAAATVWGLLMNGDIGLVARVDVLSKENYSEFATFVENYGKEFSEHFGRLLILYDPVSTKAYEKVGIDTEAPIQTNIEKTVKNLMDFVNSISPKASRPLMLIVLPSDIYNALSNDMRAKLESHSLDVSQGLINTEFLAGLIREYTRTKGNPNGCALSDRELSELVGKLAKFDSGRALIARLVGEELARNNCNVNKIKELISKAKGKAEAFIILHINGLFKVNEASDTTKEAIVKVFALRRPFISWARPGDSILTPGVVKLMGVSELSGWLAIRQHDLIEEAIGKLLDCIVGKGEGCEEFGDAPKPWKTIEVMKSLSEVSEKVRNVGSAVNYFAGNYGKKLASALKVFSNECWKRAALIIGHALAGDPIVPWLKYLSVLLSEIFRERVSAKILRKSVVESLGDALNECKIANNLSIDDYLLVGDKIPPLIMNLIRNHARALAEAFVDKYNEAVAEVRRVLGIARDRGINVAEEFYGLGLASIIAYAAGSGKVVESGDADAALHIASSTIQDVASPDLIRPILRALEPLRGKAPHRYIVLLALASNMANLDRDTVEYIFKELNEIYGDAIKGRAWSLVHAISAYTNLLRMHLVYFNREDVKSVVGRVVDLLNELDKLSPSLGVVAWAYALAPALRHEYVRELMERALGINVVDEAIKVLAGLDKLRERVQELMSDEEFRSYVESMYIKADEEAVEKVILEAASHVLSNYYVSFSPNG